MREIKFRAWESIQKKMYNNVQYGIDRGIWINLGTMLEMSDYTLMQFTGLKDKNGKEIYEGDVVRIQLEDAEKIREVKFNESMGLYEPYLEGSNEYWYTLAQLVNDYGAYVFVIGNIYENPELIDTTKA